MDVGGLQRSGGPVTMRCVLCTVSCVRWRGRGTSSQQLPSRSPASTASPQPRSLLPFVFRAPNSSEPHCPTPSYTTPHSAESPQMLVPVLELLHIFQWFAPFLLP